MSLRERMSGDEMQINHRSISALSLNDLKQLVWSIMMRERLWAKAKKGDDGKIYFVVGKQDYGL